MEKPSTRQISKESKGRSTAENSPVLNVSIRTEPFCTVTA